MCVHVCVCESVREGERGGERNSPGGGGKRGRECLACLLFNVLKIKIVMTHFIPYISHILIFSDYKDRCRTHNRPFGSES